MAGDVSYDAVEIYGDSCRPVHVCICEERSVSVYLNGMLAGSFDVGPGALDAFACGYLLCEGMIEKAQDIKSIDVRHDGVWVEAPAVRIASRPFYGDFQVESRVLLERYYSLSQYSPLGRRTGGTHCAALFTTGGGVLDFAEDPQGRGCVYKVIGKAVLAGYDLGGCFLLFSGRALAWVVDATCRAGLPLVACSGMPSASAVSKARSNGIALAAIAGLSRMIIYSCHDRITGVPEDSSGNPAAW